MSRTVKVAVVGSGLAGLTAAHLLTKPSEDNEVNFEVHLFEKASTVGMDSSSISLSATGLGNEFRIDVPMRSFQGGYYTNLIALYKTLGVKFRQADFSYSFSSLRPAEAKWDDRSITTTMIYNGSSGRSGVSKPANFGRGTAIEKQGRISRWTGLPGIYCLFFCSTIQLLLCYLLTLFHALPFWRPAAIHDLVFKEWTLRVAPDGFLARLIGMDAAWKDYVHTVLVPLLSAVCTAPGADVMNHPVEEFLDYIWLTLGTHHYVVVGGVRQVVARLTEGLRHIHLSSPIVSLKPDAHNPRCVTISCLYEGKTITEYSGFHHIILATQASGAAPILSSYLQSLPSGAGDRKEAIERQIRCLKTFQYRPAMVINHTDCSLLPDDEHDVRDLNLISLPPNTNFRTADKLDHPTLSVDSSYTMATHVLSAPLGNPEKRRRIFQTTNPIIPPRKEDLLSVATLERAIVTKDSKVALKLLCAEGSKRWWQCSYQGKTRLGELQGPISSCEDGAPGIWICGSYAHLGIPLLEGCVISARNVVEQGILRTEGTRWTQEPWVV